jgi:O-antigen ligase
LNGAVARPSGLPARALAAGSLALAVFLGGFVFHEPAPYELFLAAIIPLWLIGGLALPRAIGPLVVLFALFVAGGVLATTQAWRIDDGPLYITISAFLALSACFFAAVVARDPDRLLAVIVNAWIAAALATAGLGMAGYFGLAPGEMFTLYGRAAGGFQDPNVFGPFLVFPLAVLFQRALTRPIRRAWPSGAAALFLMLAVLLSFSRAAWGLALLAPAMMAVLMFLSERRSGVRARYIAMAVAGGMVGTVVLSAALSVEAVASLFAERARLVQEYDAGQLGRFARHLAGFDMMLEKPLGLGALEFGKQFGADEHNIWLKSLTTYGWLGFAAFVTLVLWTLAAAFPLLFRTSRYQPVLQAAYVVFLGHILIGAVIDINHWRHLYLLLGILWGLIAVDRAVARRRMAAAARPPDGLYRELIVPAGRRH